MVESLDVHLADGESWQSVNHKEDNKLDCRSFTATFAPTGGGQCRFARCVNISRNPFGNYGPRNLWPAVKEPGVSEQRPGNANSRSLILALQSRRVNVPFLRCDFRFPSTRQECRAGDQTWAPSPPRGGARLGGTDADSAGPPVATAFRFRLVPAV
jgi:hypothetical protein